MPSLKDLLANAGAVMSAYGVDEINERANSLHRTQGIVDRPTEEVILGSVDDENLEIVKTQQGPTKDLISLARGLQTSDIPTYSSGYLIWCKDTEEMWYAPTLVCLNQNFIYRGDLEIIEVTTFKDVEHFYAPRMQQLLPGIQTRKSCFILDNPGNETYEVYYDPAYPSQHYGKATPQGCFIHKYPNRFQRDMAILNLDNIYTNSSAKAAAKSTAAKLKRNEAIIVSDGAWMKDTSSFAFFYMDDTSVVKQVEGCAPSDPDQAVLISEINGAYRALSMCKQRGKKHITYYYDNTSIVNVFRNRKTEYIEEVERYKGLCIDMDALGYDITFVELHPKTGETRALDNRALQYFHNVCDAECRSMADICRKEYKAYANTDDKRGNTYRDLPKAQQRNRR